MMWAAWLMLLQGVAGTAERLWGEGRRAEAIEVLVRQVGEEPTNAAAKRRLVEAEMAVHWYAKALEHAQGLGAEMDAARGTALFRLGEFERALGKLPRTSADALSMRIEALEALGKFDDVETEVAALVKLVGEGDVRAATQLGRSAARKGEWPRAEQEFRRALEREPLDPAAMFGLGQSLVRQGRRDEGLAVLSEHRRITPLLDQLDFARRSVDLAPMHGPNHAAVGDAERALGRIERARAAYERAQELAAPADLAPIALRLARLLADDQQQNDAAVATLDVAFERCGDVRLLVRASDLLAQANRTSDALQRLERAAKLRPGDAEIEKRLRSLRGAK